MKLKTPQGAWLKGASVLVAVCTAGGLMLTQAGVASATGNTVNVGATITAGSGTAPTIECSWVLTDDNHAGGGETQQWSTALNKDIGPATSGLGYTNYTQPAQGLGSNSSSPNAPSYGGSPNSATSFVYGADDTPNGDYVSPPPCTSTGAAGSQPTQAAGTQTSPISTGVQVLPNAFDSSTSSAFDGTAGTQPRRMEVWAAVDGASAVSFNVFFPNGTEDTILGGVPIGTAPEACTTYGTSGSLLSNMFSAAGHAPVGANEISASAISNNTGTGIVDLCNDNEKGLWYQAFTISKDDPNGTYVVQVIATNTNGTSNSYISFWVIPFNDLAIDFSSVKFVSNGASPPVYFVSGDTSWDPATTGTQLPTVTNGGNSGEEIGVNFGALTCTSCTGSSSPITSFDANLGYVNGDILGADVPASAGTTAWISNNGTSLATNGQLVCPNDTPKLDLSMEPPLSASGTYSGTMTVESKSAVTTGTGDGAPYVVGSPPAYKSLTDLDANSIVRNGSGGCVTEAPVTG